MPDAVHRRAASASRATRSPAIHDVGFISDGTTGFGYAANNDFTEWKFAWAVHAGVAYNVNNNFKMELAYRYLNMGNVNTVDHRLRERRLLDRWRAARLLHLPRDGLAGHEVRHALDARPPSEQAPAYMPPLMRKG